MLAIGGNRFPFHRFEDRGPTIAAAFDDLIDVTLTTAKADLTDLAAYDAVVDYLTDSTLSDDQRDGLVSFVEDGGGYVGVHCAADLTSTASDDPDELIDAREEPVPALRELLGGHFLTHPEQSIVDVRIVDHHSPITAGLEDVSVWDEPYVLDVDEDVRVLARMDHPEHADMPVAWTKHYGDGRVFYCSLGHGTASLTDDDVQALLRNGTRWAVGVE